MLRIRGSLISLLILACALLSIPVAPAAASTAACGTRIDIGSTVFSGGRVKGSGSYTSQSCRAIDSVYLVLVEEGRERASTRVTRYPSEPSSLKFSPKDFVCITNDWHYWKTKIYAKFQGGGYESKVSNTIHVRCG